MSRYPIRKRSIVIAGHKTSISLEEPFFMEFKRIAIQRGVTLSELAGSIDREFEGVNLSSTIRLFVLDEVQQQAAGRRPNQVRAQ